ncbi:MAG: phosphoribosylanthranilate isomerase, partial [Parabacteroides sp.]|nr:phosphoribosylanthranilate isomerase [Parabacteroides sp.]
TDYAGRVDYIRFDTQFSQNGGTGRALDWSVQPNYKGETPLHLSGGIGPDSLEALIQFHHPLWAGVDLNSAFESVPGHKEVDRLRTFIQQFQTIKQR